METCAFDIAVVSELIHVMIPEIDSPGVTTVGSVFPLLSDSATARNGFAIVIDEVSLAYATERLCIPVACVPTVNWKSRWSLFDPVRVPVMLMFLCSPGASVPSTKNGVTEFVVGCVDVLFDFVPCVPDCIWIF